MFHKVLMAFVAVLALSATECLAQGTQQEQAACRPDVRKHCRHLKPNAGALVFLSCLQKNRSKLSKACRNVLESHGQ
jgi:hypothetical protein